MPHFNREDSPLRRRETRRGTLSYRTARTDPYRPLDGAAPITGLISPEPPGPASCQASDRSRFSELPGNRRVASDQSIAAGFVLSSPVNHRQAAADRNGLALFFGTQPPQVRIAPKRWLPTKTKARLCGIKALRGARLRPGSAYSPYWFEKGAQAAGRGVRRMRSGSVRLVLVGNLRRVGNPPLAPITNRN
jgi:hypothetical protein